MSVARRARRISVGSQLRSYLDVQACRKLRRERERSEWIVVTRAAPWGFLTSGEQCDKLVLFFCFVSNLNICAGFCWFERERSNCRQCVCGSPERFSNFFSYKRPSSWLVRVSGRVHRGQVFSKQSANCEHYCVPSRGALASRARCVKINELKLSLSIVPPPKRTMRFPLLALL